MLSGERTESIALDPTDWNAFRELLHRAADDVVEHLQTSGEKPAWTRTPPDSASLRDDMPSAQGRGMSAVYQEVFTDIMPYALHTTHPRFWGWVMGSGLPVGILADFLAAAMNSNVTGANHAPAHLERKVMRWLASLLGFPGQADGLLVSSCSSANLHGLAAARTARAGFDVRRYGVRHAPGPLTVYASAETHSSVQKAIELLGLGSDALRKIPVDRDFRIDISALVSQLQRDRADGAIPFCVVGNAGTVNTGAVDDLNALADLCAEQQLWFHVDGAFGAMARLGPTIRHTVMGIERADSIGFDLHKWMYLPYDVAAVLVRRGDDLRETFTMPAPYLDSCGSELTEGFTSISNMGIQLSRGFRALKVWMALESYGTEMLGQAIEANVEQARHMARLIALEPALELITDPTLNVVCFACAADDQAADSADERTRRVLRFLHDNGIAIPSHTRIRGRFAIRAAITNHRTRQQDVAYFVQCAAHLARQAAQSPVELSLPQSFA